jgi:hypothetical protein
MWPVEVRKRSWRWHRTLDKQYTLWDELALRLDFKCRYEVIASQVNPWTLQSVIAHAGVIGMLSSDDHVLYLCRSFGTENGYYYSAVSGNVMMLKVGRNKMHTRGSVHKLWFCLITVNKDTCTLAFMTCQETSHTIWIWKNLDRPGSKGFKGFRG